jgi:hypothetical protein
MVCHYDDMFLAARFALPPLNIFKVLGKIEDAMGKVYFVFVKFRGGLYLMSCVKGTYSCPREPNTY